MQRSQTAITCALGALAIATVSFGLAPQDPDPQIAALHQKVTELEEKLESYDTFMEAQATAGMELAKALDESEAAGFTAGINPKSREVLLAGLRGQAKAMQSGAEEEDAPQPQTRRGRRRGR
ncbi:MAG: hypothetical protein AAF957_23815 [Planctomycetota bacterium]